MYALRFDMRLTDESVYEYLENKSREAESPIVEVVYADIAAELGCHKNTIYNATNRLQLAGRITKTTRRGDNRGSVIELCQLTTRSKQS